MKLETAVGNRILKMGDSGPLVEQVQLRLRDLGYPLKGTGYFAGQTFIAVKAVQKRAGLVVDGRVGSKTAAALDVAISGTATLPTKAAFQEISRPLWLEAGIKLIGTKEVPGSGDNPTIIDWAKEEGGDIAKSYTHDSIPWCALYQNHLLTQAELEGTETLWALDFNADLMRERLGHGWPAVELKGPAVGAFAPMLRNGGGHIICIAGKTASGHVAGLGGNQHDAVNIADFPLSRLNKGFWWPDGVPLPFVGFEHLPLVTSNGRVSTHEA